MAHSDRFTRFHQQPEVLKNYFLLESLGVFEYIESLKLQVRDLEGLLMEATGIFSQTDVASLTSYIAECIGSRFVPTDLTFLIQDRHEGLLEYTYRNLKPARNVLAVENFTSLETFFLQFPSTIHFELFEYQFPDPEIVAELKKANPQIIVPVLGIAGLYGLILFGPKLIEAQYSESEISYIDRLMTFTAISIQNAINYKNAVTDFKTGLYNHSFFTKRLGEEWANAKRYQSDLGLLVIDIDRFKNFNDNYGHMAGDEVILAISQVIRNSVREGDVVARFGGEEFTVLFLRSDRIRTWNSAERIRKAVESTRIQFKDEMFSVTVSIGAATLGFKAPEVMDDFIIHADEALYLAKNRGRNRTVMYGESLLFSALQRYS